MLCCRRHVGWESPLANALISWLDGWMDALPPLLRCIPLHS